MEIGVFFIDNNGDIIGQFNREKYNKLPWYLKLKYKFSKRYRAKFLKPIDIEDYDDGSN